MQDSSLVVQQLCEKVAVYLDENAPKWPIDWGRVSLDATNYITYIRLTLPYIYSGKDDEGTFIAFDTMEHQWLKVHTKEEE